MKIKNKIGPKTEPCGKPLSSAALSKTCRDSITRRDAGTAARFRPLDSGDAVLNHTVVQWAIVRPRFTTIMEWTWLMHSKHPWNN